MLEILLKNIQKIVNYIGYNLIISKIKPGPINENQVILHQKHIINLKVVIDREILLKLIPKNGIIAELGVDQGDFSNKILSNTHPEKLYLIDTWASKRYNKNKMNHVRRRFQKEIDTGRVIIVRGKSETELKKFEDGYFDWVYIDTAHSYQQTVKELELCRLKVKDGGIIAGHDYCRGNIKKALAYGVVQAVNQFCVKNNWEFILLTHETNRALSFAIKKI